ncbi:S8 family peptidase [Bdellovibrio reynosensis]|uniref:S8 family serine peptidase n=1 Tax=Bdellovibrio reynosensis TaxID=2835041 RepID=A0ABY4C978_9BACT|nr:S8 family peptidase [Bdellovibrio reynosensis]UOF00452.1 S8 family serine peptidase [Bdellovibrio reynosensis]
MDVQKILSAVACIFVLAACSNEKSASTVFPENGALDSNACLGQAVQNKFIVQWEDGKFTVESAANAEEFTKNFIEPQLEKIRFVEFDRQLQIKKADDVRVAGISDSWGQDMIGARNVWSQGIYGQNIKVAVVDSFVDTTHPQLAPRIAVNTAEVANNGVDDDRNGVVDDYYGAVFVSVPSGSDTPSSHGSHVAGIIAADHTKGSVEGVAPQAQIIPAQFIANDGGGSLGDAVLALQYSANRGAKIINASWGGAPCVTSLRNTFIELEKKGILVIVAAGNDGRDVDLYPEFPASFNLANQITVAASSVTDFMTAWSNSGFQYVHVAAPGERILSTIPGNSTAYMDGTSMAAPFVSGAAALLWSARPNATAAQIKTAILQSVDVDPGHEFKVNTRGRINVQKALQLLKQLVP